MNVVALYLPQFHRIKENDQWWGEGHTEWVTVKKGIIKFNGQYQPRIPLNNNYYDLSDIRVMEWQTQIAKQHGVNAFCVYHYWFNGKTLLEKPMENYLESKINFPYFFCWANETWTKVWDSKEGSKEILASNDYSNMDYWDEHFYYCLKFFKDKRYICNNGSPIFVIYNPIDIKYTFLSGMINRWNELAIKEGFNGMVFLYQTGNSLCYMDKKRKDLFSYAFEYYPGLVDWREKSKLNVYLDAIKRRIYNSDSGNVVLQDYDDIWTKIISYNPKDVSLIPGAFTDWDNSARRKHGAKIILNASPSKFRNYFAKQIDKAKNIYKKNMIIVFAWNEWSEGGYLEPDEKFGYGYLEAIKETLIEKGEFQKEFDRDKVF